jgi:uncharacterized protein (TIGR03118 family)
VAIQSWQDELWQGVLTVAVDLLSSSQNVWIDQATAGSAWAKLAASTSQGIATTFSQTNLISDGSVPAQTIDPNLINPWGVSYGSIGTGGEFWISDTGTGLTSIDTVNASTGAVGLNLFPPVTIPAASAGETSSPTGQVYNSFLTSNAFMLPDGSPASFIFATKDGTIAGWNVSEHSLAVTMVDNSANPADGDQASGLGANYTGLAIGMSESGPALYAANFRHGTVDVFNQNFNQVSSFTDANLPAGYAPFNVQELDNDLFVTFALQDATKTNDVAGAGNGYVDEFDLQGNLLQRVASAGSLDSPWGLATAPSSFGSYAGDLLVGNFGDGTINAYNLDDNNTFGGQLTNSTGNPIVVPDLWELIPGNTSGALGGDPNTLYFTAGLQNEEHGLFGSLTPNAGSDTTGALWTALARLFG